MTADHGLARVRVKLADVDRRVDALTAETARRNAGDAADREASAAAHLAAMVAQHARTQDITSRSVPLAADLARSVRGPYIEVHRGGLMRRAEALQRDTAAVQRDAAATSADAERTTASIATRAAAWAREVAHRTAELDAERAALRVQETEALGWIEFHRTHP
jgi:hypothetical protein